MNNSRFRFLALIIAAAQLLSLSTIPSFESSNDRPIEHSETIQLEEAALPNTDLSTENLFYTPEHTLTPIVCSETFAAGEPINLSFDHTDVVDYYYIADGITVTEESSNSMQFTLTAADEFGSVDVYADYGNGEVVKSSVYTYKYGDTVYVSDIAKDQAWHTCMNEQYEAGLITLAEWEEAYFALSRTFVEEVAVESNSLEVPDVSLTATASNTNTVTGTLFWADNEDNDTLPLKLTKVELHDKDTVGSRCIATTYTDENGHYTFTFDNSDPNDLLESGGLDIFIRWYMESETFKVAPDVAITNYTFDSTVVEDVSTGATTTFSYYTRYDEGINAFKAVYIQQGMLAGQRFAIDMGMSTDNFLNVVFPYTFDDDAAFCFGVLAGNCFSGIGANAFKDIDTLIHEYGHFVERSLGVCGATLWDIIIHNTDHTLSGDHFYSEDDKTFAMNLVWSEAWATAFSLIAQDFYKTEYDVLPGFADVKYGNTDYTYETLDVGQNGCEAQEKAVIAVLWDLFDSEADETDEGVIFDNVALGYQAWWNCTTRAGTYTLTDFVNVIETYYPSLRGDIGAIMTEYHISPGNLTVTNQSSISVSTPPTLSWIVNGSINNPNDRFQVVFYDNNGNYICETPNITSNKEYDDIFNYPVPSNIWNQVTKDRAGNFTINVAVRGYHTKEPVSGPYISQYTPIPLTANTNFIINSSSRYTEKIATLQPGGYIEYNIVFTTGGTKLFQTFGTKDTMLYLYDENGILLDSDDDSGYNFNSLISYDVTPAVPYRVKVKFFSGSQSGDIKLAITPTDNYSTFESIYVGTNTWASRSTTLTPYNVALLRYNVPTEMTVTFTMEADFDTYLYIIDPRSTGPISSSASQPSTYNDDGAGNLQAKITKTLDTNIPYLIVISAYNPSTQSGRYTLHFGY